MLEKTLSGRYKIVKYLGGGGFGQTFFAEDIQLPGNPLCVVKQLQPKSTDPFTLKTARLLFDREAEVLYKLGNHDQIPRLLAHFEEEQEFYLVQEFIDGYDLTEELSVGKLVAETQVIVLLQDVLTILEFVHQQNVIHRDIKPSNLMRRKQDGKIILIDFGAVKQVSIQNVNEKKDIKDTTLTVAIGSPGYMPNEQIAGKPQFCSDIYALGMLGIQALTSLPPKQLLADSKTSEICWRKCLSHNALNKQVQVSSALADILDKMVLYDYRQRYQTTTQVLQALQELIVGSSVNSSKSTILLPLPPQASPSQSDHSSETIPLDLEITQPRFSSLLISKNISINTSNCQVELQDNQADHLIFRNKYSRLMGRGTGIALVLALAFGMNYFYGVNLSTAENQWAKKISLSKTLTGDSINANPIALSQDGKSLVVGGEDGKIRLWDLGSGNLKYTFKGHSSEISSVIISPNSQLLISGSADETIKVWNLKTGEQLHTLAKKSKGIRALTISPDSQTLVSGDAVGTIEVWNLINGQQLNFFAGHDIWVTSLAISPDGQTIVSSSTDKTIKAWELKTGALIYNLTNDKSRPILAVAMSPKGQTFASSDVDGTVKLWDLRSGKLIQTLITSSGRVSSLVFKPNGEIVVSGGANGAIQLWDLQTDKPLRTFSGHSAHVKSLAMSLDGKTLVSSSQDKTIKIWRSP